MKTKLIFMLFLLPCLACGYNWNLFGPAGIKTYDILFNAGASGLNVISMESGICVNDGPGWSWNTYTLGGLPVFQCVPLDNEHILLVMGDGSISDGIYTFSFTTHQFVLVTSFPSPAFILLSAANQKYYAGSRTGGLLESLNGMNWNAIPQFNSQPVVSMDAYNNNLVITKGYLFQGLYYSSDTGNTWTQSTGNGNFLTYLAFHPNGTLYGVIPFSNSGSLRKTMNYENWSVCYWDYGINTVGFDAVGNVLVGYNPDLGTNQGIAKYDTILHTISFLNEGLPNTYINRIRMNPILSSITIFCCTNSGVYYSNDYLTGLHENMASTCDEWAMSFPNPCITNVSITFSLPSMQSDVFLLELYNFTGKLVKRLSIPWDGRESHSVQMDATGLPPGIYYYRISSGTHEIIRKLVVI